jgi:hypothetical protein
MLLCGHKQELEGHALVSRGRITCGEGHTWEECALSKEGAQEIKGRTSSSKQNKVKGHIHPRGCKSQGRRIFQGTPKPSSRRSWLLYQVPLLFFLVAILA